MIEPRPDRMAMVLCYITVFPAAFKPWPIRRHSICSFLSLERARSFFISEFIEIKEARRYGFFRSVSSLPSKATAFLQAQGAFKFLVFFQV